MKESRDILTLFEALSNHEVFTPPRVARAMLDLLPKEIWFDPSIRLLDPATKSGVFLREAFFRFFDGLHGKGEHLAHDGKTYDLNDRQQCINHILKNMLYGIAISELTSYMARRTLYGVMHANTDKQIASVESFECSTNFKDWSDQEKYDFIGRHTYNEYFDHTLFCTLGYEGFESEGNIFYPTEEVNKLVVEAGSYEIEDTYLPFIEEETQHQKILDIRDGKMKFDVIVTNPPYQLSDGAGGKGSSAKPIYHLFVEQAIKMAPRYLTMIIPSRWFTDGKGLDAFRDSMLSDRRIKKIVDYWHSMDCFPGVDIAGGVCYFLWDAKHKGQCEVVTNNMSGSYAADRTLDEFETFIRDGRALPILYKVKTLGESTMGAVVSSRKPFGLESSARPDKTGSLSLFWSGGTGPLQRSRVQVNSHMIPKWKTIVSKVSYDHAGMPDKNGQRRVLSRVEVLPPNCVCTETYLIAGLFDTKEEAENLAEYLKTKFARFLISLLSATQNITRGKFDFVPVLPMDEKWTDEKLFERYKISEDDVRHIDALIKDMS